MCSSRSHWNDVPRVKTETSVSWYQPHSLRSLALINHISPDGTASVIDVGAGASTLVDDLVSRGFADITALDIAAPALQRAKTRLGKGADKVTWLTADVTLWTPARTWDIWHDRALFHFLTDRDSQDAYVATLSAATRPGSTAIISTFTVGTPQSCNSLPVDQYSAECLAARLGPAFALAMQGVEHHTMPSGADQLFLYAVLNRRRKC